MTRTISACGLLLIAVAFSGCGGGTSVQVSNDSGNNGRAVPLIGIYSGGLLNLGSRNALEFTLQRNGAASGVLRLLDTGQRFEMTGQVSSDRSFVLQGVDFRIDGTFTGAFNPNDTSEYIRGGVLFYGTWVLQTGGSGRVEAAHETWPPPPSFTGGTTIDDPYYDDPFPSGGGTTTGGGTSEPPVDGGFDAGTPDDDSPPATGGEPTDDGIVYRQEVELG